MLDLVFRPDPAHRDPVYRQLADHLAELISAQRLRSGERGRAMASALTASMPEGTRFREPCGGSSIWVELPLHVDADALAVAARERGIAYASGEPFRVESVGPPALLLSFAALAPDEIRGGVAELAALARTCARKRRLAPARGASRRAR